MAITLKAFSQELKSIPNDKNTLQFLFNKYGKLGIKFIYEKKNEKSDYQKYNRIMFGSSVRSDYYKFLFKGAIIDENFNLICLPVSPPIINYKISFISNKIYEAKITPIVDGTTVTLYYYKNNWTVSTYRGYDVGDYTRMGNKTFKDVLMEIFAKYPNFSFSKLKKKHCYTLGFKSKHFHPFIDPSNSNTAWYIRSFDLHNLTDTIEDIGIPKQKNLDISDISQLVNNCKKALTNYISSSVIDYGYIISLNGRSYLMESSLLKFIRNTFYYSFSNSKTSINDIKKLTNFNEVNYRVLRALLNNINVSTFRSVFPQYNHIYKKLTNSIDMISDIIINNSVINMNSTNSTFVKDIKKRINKSISLEQLPYSSKIEIIYNFVCIHEYTNNIFNLIFNNA